MTIEDLIRKDDINGIACEENIYGKIYSEGTLREWIKDLNPQQGKPGRPKNQGAETSASLHLGKM